VRRERISLHESVPLCFVFFSLILALTIPGLASALGDLANPLRARRVVVAGVIANGVSLAIPVLFVVFAIGRVVLLRR
jgi:hypothetical protein